MITTDTFAMIILALIDICAWIFIIRDMRMSAKYRRDITRRLSEDDPWF